MRSFLLPQLSKTCLGNSKIKLPQLGEVRIRQSRPLPTGFEAKQARIIKKWLKLQNKIAKIHEQVSNARKDWHYKLANHLVDKFDNIFVEDINFKSWSRGIVRKQSLDSGIGQFINEILPYICWKRDKFYLKVNKDGTSQECPNCGGITGKKTLDERVHNCQFCGYTNSRDISAAQVIRNRGNIAVGLPV